MADGENLDVAEKRTLEEHQATFNGFLKAAVIVAIISAAILIFLAFVGT